VAVGLVFNSPVEGKSALVSKKTTRSRHYHPILIFHSYSGKNIMKYWVPFSNNVSNVIYVKVNTVSLPWTTVCKPVKICFPRLTQVTAVTRAAHSQCYRSCHAVVADSTDRLTASSVAVPSPSNKPSGSDRNNRLETKI
jgi:hypothetical protein